MSQESLLNESDIDTLITLLLRSQQLRTREALCVCIGIDPKRLSFIRDSSDYDFFLLLIRYLNEIGEEEALCKLCCKQLFPIFSHGTYAPILRDIAAKLHCNQELSQNSPNKKQPTVLSSIPASRVSVNPFNQLAKNKLITGGTILLIGLAGFSIYNQNSYSPNNLHLTKQPEPSCVGGSCVRVDGKGLLVNYVEGGVKIGGRQSVDGHIEIWGSDFHHDTSDKTYRRCNSQTGQCQPIVWDSNEIFRLDRNLPNGSRICARFWRKVGNGYADERTACVEIKRD